MRVGFVFNVRRGQEAASSDAEAEFDDPAAIGAIREAIEANGHDVVELEADQTLPAALVAAEVDAVFNIAEGQGSRSREAQVPALLELLGIPYTGSDAVTLGITLDKALAKTVVAAAGVATPAWFVLGDGESTVPEGADYPLVVKPLHEGSSKGIDAGSVVSDDAALRGRAAWLADTYGQPVLCEAYVDGRELTVGVLGHPARVLPAMEVVFLDGSALPLYSYDVKQRFRELVRYEIPAPLEAAEREALEAASLRAFHALGCRDVARLDFRIDADGVPQFLECNPLPGLAPGVGDLTLIAAATGLPYEALIGEILAGALARAAAG